MGMILYQNREFYLNEQTLVLNFLFTKLEMPPMANATHVLLYFLAGMVLASVSFYRERFKLRREIKNLNVAFSSCAERVTAQKSIECNPPKQKFFKLTEKISKLREKRRSKKDAAGKAIAITDGSQPQPF